jgi:exodeoxyribonuclease I
MPNIAVIDCEAQSSSTSTGKLISITGIYFNDNFEELDRFEFFCSNVPGYIPDPYSLWVNKGLKKLKESNMSHYQMMLEVHKYIKKWSPCQWATWNGHGYDFPLIEKENYKSLLPIYTLKVNGNEATDFLPFARAAKVFHPDCLETSISAAGNPVFKLEDLGMKNFPNLDKSKFHTATMDVEVSALIMQRIKERAKPIFDSSMLTTSKQKAKDLILKNHLFTTCLYFFGKIRAFASTYFFDHPEFTWPMVWLCEKDPRDLMALDYKSLKEVLKKPGPYIRAIPLKHPVILNISYALKSEPFKTIGLDKLKEHADIIKNNPKFAEDCSKVVLELYNEKKQKRTAEQDKALQDPHNQLYYGGFPKPEEQKKAEIFHSLDWGERYDAVSKFEDKRFKYFGERLVYQNQPEALPREVFQRIHLETAERVLRLEEKNFTTIPMAEHLIDSIRAEKDITKEKLDYMNEVDAMIKEMRVTYEKALGKSDSDNSNDFEVPKFIQDKTPEEKEQVVSLEERSKKKLNNTRKIKKDIA